MRRAIWLVVLIGTALKVGALHASAQDIPEAYVVAGNNRGVPPEVLYAVASAESVVSLKAGRRPWPWTLNVAGKSLRFEDRASACQALTRALERTRIVDVGIAQLNVRWHPQLFGVGQRFATPCDGLDPYANLDEAAQLIRQHFNATGDWMTAAGRYHHPAGGQHAAHYRKVVSREITHMGISQPTSNASPMWATSDDVIVSPRSTQHSRKLPVKTPESMTWITPTPRSGARSPG